MRENNIRYIKRKKECLRQHQSKQAWDMISSISNIKPGCKQVADAIGLEN